MRTVDLILRKRGGDELSVDEIRFLVNGYTTGEIPDYQMAALLMATWFSGMTDRELSALTEERVRWLYRQRWDTCYLEPGNLPSALDVQYLGTTLKVLKGMKK